ncbi:ABC transporter ATP-binding protein [Dermabacteraceae bacterium P13101]
MSNTALEVVGLRKTYRLRGREVRAADGIDLAAHPGQITALLGPNGAGKTTTVGCCVGLLTPDAGTVRVLGQDPLRADAAHRARIGVMLQDGGLFTSAKAGQLLRYAEGLYPRTWPLDDLIERLDLSGFLGRVVRRLSGGQKQRLSLALALLGRPDMLFLDEPTAGMDPQVRRQTWQLLRELTADGACVLLTTHHMEEAEQLASRIAIVAAGKVVAEGSSEDLTRLAEHQGTLSFTTSEMSPENAKRFTARVRELAAEFGTSVSVQAGQRRTLEDVVIAAAQQHSDATTSANTATCAPVTGKKA